jgi:hypothetical protein
MKHRQAAAWMAAAALTLGLAACGGSSGAGSSSTPTGQPETQPQTQTTATDGGSDLTAPGAQLKLGQSATVGWVPLSSYNASGAQKALKLKLTVEAIEKGTIDDFENIELDAAEQNSTPYYVKVKIESLDPTAPPSSDDPDVTVEGIDDRGQEQTSVTFLGEFPRCTDTEVPDAFSSGDSFESCLTYLLPGGGSIESVHWADGPAGAGEVTPYFEKPIVWEGS